MSLNNISKVGQLKHIENLPLITEVDFCVNPLQNARYYRLQCMFHMPQLRMLDGVEITSEEKVKAENLHGYDLQDREIIFKSLLPEEKFVDRRIQRIEDVAAESDEEHDASGSLPLNQVASNNSNTNISGGQGNQDNPDGNEGNFTSIHSSKHTLKEANNMAR